MALTITGIGGFCLLIGLILLGNIVGSYDLDKILASGDLIRNHQLYLPALIFILLGALTKSAPVSTSISGCRTPCRRRRQCQPSTAFGNDGEQAYFLLVRFWPVLSGTYGGSGFSALPE